MKKSLFLAAFLALLSSADCGEGATASGSNMNGPGGNMNGPGGNMNGPGGNMNGPGMLVSIDITPQNPTLGQGATQQFTAKATYSDSSSMDIGNGVIWSIGDVTNMGTGVATLSATGLATGLTRGQALVTAQYLGQAATTKLQVATPVLINFDDVKSGVKVTTQYQQYVTFSSDAGIDNVTLNFASSFHTSAPNILCATANCKNSTFLDFKNPVSALKFNVVGVDGNAKAAEINVFVRGTKTATLSVDGHGMTYVPVPIDLSSYSDVSRIEIVNITDPNGIGCDDFSFVSF